MTSPFDTPRQTVAIGRDALKEFEHVVTTFFRGTIRPPEITPVPCYSLVEHFDDQSGWFTYCFKITTPYPLKMTRLVTEAIQCGKNAFDQAIYAACAAVGAVPTANVHMPWGTTPNDMMGKLTRMEIPAQFWPAIKRQEPYPTGDGYSGGNDPMRELAKLANAKHTIGFAVNATTFFDKFPRISGVNVYAVELKTRPGWHPADDEIFIARTSARAKIHDNYKLTFRVAISGPEPMNRFPAEVMLAHFLDNAEALISDLEAIVADM